MGTGRRGTFGAARSRRSGVAALALGLLLVAPLVDGSGFSSGLSGPTDLDLDPAARVRLAAGEPPPAFVPGQIVVRFAPGVASEAQRDLLGLVGAVVERELLLAGTVLARLPTPDALDSAIAVLNAQPSVLYAEPNLVGRISVVPNDLRFGELWGLNNSGQVVAGTAGLVGADIHASEAWDVQTGSGDVVVAVLDTGILADHPDLADRIWRNPGETGADRAYNLSDDDGNGVVDDYRGYDFVNLDNDPHDANGHGTHVAGTIGAAGNNSLGVVGVNWNVTILPVQVCDQDGYCPTDAIADGIVYAARAGADIVSMSLGLPGSTTLVADAIASAPGTLFVVAAGNEEQDVDAQPVLPCSLPFSQILCVAATNQTDGLADFSNWGIQSVDVAAPGTNILSTVPGSETLFFDDLESGFTNWTPSPFQGLPWGHTNETASSGNWSMADSPGGNYSNASDTWVDLVTPLDLTGRVGCFVDFDLRLDTAVGDVFRTYAATDIDVNSTFFPLLPAPR